MERCLTITIKPDSKEIKYCSIGDLSSKEKETKFYTEGFIATDHPDRTPHPNGEFAGDIIPMSTLQSIVTQINNQYTSPSASMCSERHDWIKNKDANTPIAGVKEGPAELRDLGDGHHGVYVKTILSKTNPRYEEVKTNVEDGLYPGYSIEYETNDYSSTTVGDKKYRVLNDINLHGYGFANARMIANPHAEITEFGYKELINIKEKEDSKMSKEVKEETPEAEVKPEEVAPEEEVQDSEESPVEEAPAEEPEKEEPKKEEAAEESDETKEMAEFRKYQAQVKEVKAKEIRTKEIMDTIKTMEPQDLPRFQNDDTNNASEIKTMVDGCKKTHMECKEWTSLPDSDRNDSARFRTQDVNVQLKEAARLHNELIKTQGSVPYGPMRVGEDSSVDLYKDAGLGEATSSGLATPSLEIKESHWKNLEVKANPLASTTNKISAASHYQAAAEMADIYDPVIYNLLNDKTTFYGLLRKVDGSKYSNQYGFRARYARSTVTGAAAEGVSNITPSSTGRVRLQQPFKYYYAGVAVTGQAIAFARAAGAIGDVMAAEVADATKDLLRDINSDLLTGTEDGSADGNELMGLTYVCEKGTSYTDIYNQVSRNTYKLEGNSESASSANITKGRLRKAIRACEAGDTDMQANNGGLFSTADRSDLIFVTHHVQKDKILALFDDAQRFNSVSARAGFEGMPTFDGIPIHADNQCTNSVLFLVDMKNTFLVVSVPPTFTAWGQRLSYDESSGFIKTYHNLVCTAPGNNYMCTSLATA